MRRSPDGRKLRWQDRKSVERVPETVLAARRRIQLEGVADSLAGALHRARMPYTDVSRKVGRDMRKTLSVAMKGGDISARTLADVATALGMRVRVTFEAR